jgi:multiple sugar transport system ATP-binding protein
MAEVKLEMVSKTFAGGIRAVRDVTIEVGDQEFVVLVGPSGCGKTTILRMIAGLETCDQGKIYIGQQCVNNIAPKDRDVAMVFQNYALYPHMTVFENMAFGLALRHLGSAEIERRVREAARILGIEDLLKRKPRELSGGQRQRVAVGRTIVRKPKVFLFDEPLSNLDARLRVQMRMELARLHAQLKTTILYVTHDQVEAMTLGERIVVLKDGTVQQIDRPQPLYDRPSNLFVAGFIGSPPMNLIRGKLINNGGLSFLAAGAGTDWDLSGVTRTALPAGQDVILGLRPEDLSVGEQGSIGLTVEVVEPVGGEIYVYGRFADVQLCVSLPKEAQPGIGDVLRLGFDRRAVHLFDAGTGQALT